MERSFDCEGSVRAILRSSILMTSLEAWDRNERLRERKQSKHLAYELPPWVSDYVMVVGR